MVQQSPLYNALGMGYTVQGKYRLENKLCEGGGGVVWEVTDPEGRHIALKFLKWSPTKSRTEVADRFKNEFAILKTLAHPNIAQIYDFGLDTSSGLYFFTSELLTAGDFRTLVKEPIPLLEEMLLQALRSLEYLRGHKLLHLDIKPHNLLLREEGGRQSLALIDFGLATFRPPDRPGGTPNYMAPELIAKRLGGELTVSYPEPDHRTDLYSLGVTFYHCLTGVQPFAVKDNSGKLDVMETLKRHFSYDPPPPSAHRSDIPAYLDRIIMKLMARHPDDRYPSAIVAAQALQYSSPRRREPECIQTLLAYLPKEGKLIGRRHEYALIESSIKAVADAKPHVTPIVCIVGGRGTGRSRLLKAIKPLAQRYEMDVAVFGEGDPFTTPALDGILDDGTRSPARAVLIDGIEGLLEHRDKGAGDGSAMNAFISLLRRLKIQQRIPDSPPPRLFLAFTIDTDRVDFARTMMDLKLDHAVCHIVELGNFTEEDVSDYLAALLGEAPDGSVIDQLMRCTGGNPLYITEHLEQMISQGKLFSLAGRPDASTLEAIGIDFSQTTPPRSLADSIMEKLGALTPESQRTALTMACWSRPISIEELIATSGGYPVDKEVLSLVGAGLIQREKTSGRLTFANSLSSRIIRDHSKREDIAKTHDDIATYLRSSGIHHPEEIDVHLAYGSNTEERVPALRRMAERALDGKEPLVAAHHLETMHSLIDETNVSDRAQILELIGKAYARAHRDREAKSAYKNIFNLTAPKLLKQEFHAKSAELLGLLSMRRRNLKDARRHFDEALGSLGEVRENAAQRIRIQNLLASVELREGRIEKALDLFQQTLNAADKDLNDEEISQVTNNELGDALIRAGRIGDAIEVLTRDLESAIKANDAERTANIHYLLGNAYRHDSIKKYKDAERHYDDGLTIAKSLRLIEQQVRILNGLGNLNLMLKKPSDAMANYRDGLKLAQQIEGETTSVEIMIGIGFAHQQLGEHEHTIEFLEAALDFSKTPKASSAGLLKRYRPAMYVFLGDAYYQKHHFTRAMEYLTKAKAIDSKHPLTTDMRYSMYATFVEIYLEQGKLENAKRLMPTVEAIASKFPPAKKHFKELKERMGQ